METPLIFFSREVHHSSRTLLRVPTPITHRAGSNEHYRTHGSGAGHPVARISTLSVEEEVGRLYFGRQISFLRTEDQSHRKKMACIERPKRCCSTNAAEAGVAPQSATGLHCSSCVVGMHCGIGTGARPRRVGDWRPRPSISSVLEDLLVSGNIGSHSVDVCSPFDPTVEAHHMKF